MTFRVRSYDHRVPITGTYWANNVLYPKTINVGDWKTTQDHVGNFQVVNPFEVQHNFKVSPFLNGRLLNSSGGLLREFTSFPLGYHSTAVPTPRTKFPAPSTAQLIDWAWEILAKSNPSSPYVNMTAFIGELKDLPSLVRGWGSGLLRDAAQGYISWRWAVRPMISDLRKLYNFSKAAENRLRELQTLRDGKGLRRRVMLASDQLATNPVNVTIHSQGALLGASRTDVYTRKAWGTAVWKVAADSDLPMMDDDELDQFNKILMRGANTHGDLEALWELCPWSWFVDWFSNVGTIMQATNNSIGCSWHRLAVMITSTTEIRFELAKTNPTWVTLSGDFDWRYVLKERYPVFPAIPIPLPTLPFLTNGQLSILGSLAALRFVPPRRA